MVPYQQQAAEGVSATCKLYLVTTGNKKPAVQMSLPASMSDDDWETLYQIVRRHAKLKSSPKAIWFRAWPLRPARRNGKVYWHRKFDGNAGEEITLLPDVDVSPAFIRELSQQMRVDMNITRVRVVQPSKMLSAENIMREWLLYRKDRADKEAAQD